MITPQGWLRQWERLVLLAISLLAIVLAFVVLVGEVFLSRSAAFHEHVPTLTLFLLSAFVLSYLARELKAPHLTRWTRLGITEIYKSRSEPGQHESYTDLLRRTRKDAFLVGITLKDATKHHGSLLVDRANQGCSIRLLMLSPKYRCNHDPVLDPVAYAEGRNLTSEFNIAVSNIRLLAKAVIATSGSFEVRFYHRAPTLSLTIRDGSDFGSGRMRVELLPHHIPFDSFRPLLELIRVGDDDLFHYFQLRYEALWDSSQIYISVRDRTITINDHLDQELSTDLTLPPMAACI